MKNIIKVTAIVATGIGIIMATEPDFSQFLSPTLVNGCFGLFLMLFSGFDTTRMRQSDLMQNRNDNKQAISKTAPAARENVMVNTAVNTQKNTNDPDSLSFTTKLKAS